ncbi:MAG: AIR carboxylase family protein [Bacteriovoracaceae bacterium]
MKIAIIMGSQNDWKIMKDAATLLDEFKIPYEKGFVCT